MARATGPLLLFFAFLPFALAEPSWAGHPDATLLRASLEGDFEDAVVSLVHGANPDAHYAFVDDQTPLMIAARMGHTRIVTLLLSRGADPTLTLDAPERPEHGWSAHDFAREAGMGAAAEAIRSYGVEREARHRRGGGTLAFGRRLDRAARERTWHRVSYDGSYREIDYPGGDVPPNLGVCTDVVIRSYRALGIDLQVAVHEEMTAHFEAFPKLWQLHRPDPNIDHRRVPILQTFLARRGHELPITHRASDYLPGDLVTWVVAGRLPHIGIVTGRVSSDGERPLIVHNIGRGPLLDDMLFEFPITGHYRYEGDL